MFNQDGKLLLFCKFFIIFSVLGFSFTIFQEIHAENSNLFVSANNKELNNTSFNSTFAGPMVIEVIIDDDEFSTIKNTISGPEVLVGNKTLDMVQAQNGKWYGYFADRLMAEIADSTTHVNGKGLDFGGICDPSIARDNILKIDNSHFFKNASKISYNDPLCENDFNKNNLNVLRNAKKANDSIPNNIGQAYLSSSDAWPFIQLFDFQSNESVIVQYVKNNKTQEVILNFESLNPEFIDLTLEGKTGYVPNSQVLLSLQDGHLNIDPTDEDSWTFLTKSPGGLFYQFFDKNGNSSVDGTQGAIDISTSLSDLMFDENGRLLLNPYDEDFPAVVNLQNNNLQTISISEEISHAHSFEDSLPLGSQPITFMETNPNSGIFNNYDIYQKSNLVISNNAIKETGAWLEYNKKLHGILVHDYGISWDKPEYFGNDTAVITVNAEIMDKDSNIKNFFEVQASSRYDPKGISVKVFETKTDSGIFKGKIALNSQKRNTCIPVNDPSDEKLKVFEDDRIYASFSYVGFDDNPTTTKSKATVSSLQNQTKGLEIDILDVSFPNPSDYYFSAIEQLEEKLEENNFAFDQYCITTDVKTKNVAKTVTEKFEEAIISQKLTIVINNRTEYDKIFDYNIGKNFTSVDESAIRENIKGKLSSCQNNSEKCVENVNSILSIMDNQIGNHTFTESIFYNVTHFENDSTELPSTLVNETKSLSGEQEKLPLIRWMESLPLLKFLNIDMFKWMLPNAIAEPISQEKPIYPPFGFINGFSYGFGFGKTFGYDYEIGDFEDLLSDGKSSAKSKEANAIFSTEIRFAAGLGLGLRIPSNVTVMTTDNYQNSTDFEKPLLFQISTLDLDEEQYQNLGIPFYQTFEGYEFAAYLGPEISGIAGISGKAGDFELDPYYEYEKKAPIPDPEHFVPPLNGTEQFTEFDYSISDVIPFLDITRLFFSGDAWAGFNGYLNGTQMEMSITSKDNSTTDTLLFATNNSTISIPYPSNSTDYTIGNLTYHSSINLEPKIGGAIYFGPITILERELTLGNVTLNDIGLNSHDNTIKNYTFFINGTNDDFLKYDLEIGGKTAEYWSNVGQFNGTADPKSKSLILKKNSTKSGELQITLPRDLIDSKTKDDRDVEFIVTFDDEQPYNLADSHSDKKTRTITMQIPENNTKIQIYGTHVIPEFGIIATLILIFALSCVIGLVSNSKLRTRF